MTIIELDRLEALQPTRPVWKVQATALWQDDALPPTITEHQVGAALSSGARLVSHPGGYDIAFTVEADRMFLANRAAMARWSHLVEVAALPDWDLVSVSVTAVRPSSGSDQS